MEKQLVQIVQRFGTKKVLVLGDAILDTYVKGTTERLCREAPAPVLNVLRQEHSCGGAANTAINLAALGAKTHFVTVTGQDDNSRRLIDLLRRHGVHTAGIVRAPERTTIAKKRLTADGNILLRLDEGQTCCVNQVTEAALLKHVYQLYPRVDAVILSDYGYGTLTDGVLEAIAQLQIRMPKPLLVDSKDLARFQRLKPTAVKPNYEEAIHLLNLAKAAPGKRTEQIRAHAGELLSLTGATCVAATVDSEGVVVLQQGQAPHTIRVVPRSNKHSIGAGDTFISAMTLAMACECDAVQSSEIGGAAASVILQKEGTAICTNEELRACFATNPKRMTDLAALASKMEASKLANKRIVFTNGCFDILNIAHIALLSKAKALGDILVVGINSDASTKRLKGESRPINSLEDRLAVLSAVQSVDYLIPFEEDSAVNILEAIRPHVFVKGGTYSPSTIAEIALVEEIGCQLVMLPLYSNGCRVNVLHKIQAAAFSTHAC